MKHPSTNSGSVTAINEVLDAFFAASQKEAAAIDRAYEQLWNSLYSLIKSGGKRLRPQMTLLTYEAFGGTELQRVAPVAAAQELLHFSLLIHDDIIDRDYIRYGTRNIAGQYKEIYAKYLPDDENLTHFSHSAAILGGDLMLSGAYSLIAQSGLPDAQKTKASRLLARGIFDVAGGELLDTESSFVPYREGNALTIARFKTASYSFVTPLLTGAELAGATQSQLSILKEFAVALGLAFQLVDDLLGVFGDEHITGKSNVSDIVEGKHTFMIECAEKNMNVEEHQRFMISFGNPNAAPEEIMYIKNLLQSTSAKVTVEEKIKSYVDAAETLLTTLNVPLKNQEAFRTLITKVVRRTF